MARRSRDGLTAQRQAVLAAIARREWLLQMLVLAAAGCGRRDDAARSRASTLILAVPYNARETLVPDATAAERLVFLPLMTHNANGELEGRLAERWEHSADYHEWTYHLRAGLQWEDGVPVTAHDVAFTLELIALPALGIIAPDAFEKVTIRDDHTLTVRSRYPARKYHVNVVCYPKHRLQHLDRARVTDWDFWTSPIGNGPYRLVRYLPDTMMEFEANGRYYRGKPRVNRVVLKFTKDAATSELLARNVDAIPEANAAQLPPLIHDRRLNVYRSLGGGASAAIFWNASHALFQDVRVRRALTLAIDRKTLREVVNVGGEIPIVDAPSPFMLDELRRGELPDPLSHDPDEANRLLDAAGWRDRASDGVRMRAGVAFRFTAPVISMSPVFEMAVYVQDQFRRIGVEMNLVRMENALVRELVRGGRFAAAVSFLSNNNSIGQTFGPPFPSGYRNVELVALLDEVSATADPVAETRAWHRIADIFRADVPATILAPMTRTVIADKRIHGLGSPFAADLIGQMEDLWLED